MVLLKSVIIIIENRQYNASVVERKSAFFASFSKDTDKPVFLDILIGPVDGFQRIIGRPGLVGSVSASQAGVPRLILASGTFFRRKIISL